MAFTKHIYTLAAAFTLCVITTQAQQEKPVGYWNSFLPYNTAIGIATDGTQLYTICNEGFFTFNPHNGSTPVPYSKVEGMSDLGMQCIAYDAFTSTTVLVYSDGNIDLFKEKENTFYNVADLKIKNVAGTKTVYQAYTENGIAYLSSALGILVLDLTNHTFLETYQFINTSLNNETVPVYNFTSTDSFFYAATGNGLYRVLKTTTDLQNYQAWQRIDSTHAFNTIANLNNTLYFSNQQSVYKFVNDTLIPVYTPVGDTSLRHIDAGYNKLFISEFVNSSYSGNIKIMDLGNNIIDSFTCPGKPVQIVQLQDSSIWIADSLQGLQRRIGTTGPDQTGFYEPIGPIDPHSFDIYANNKDLWIAHGGFGQTYGADFSVASHDGFSNFANGTWKGYRQYAYNPVNSMQDFVAIVKDESNGTLYAGSYLQGLFILNKDGSYQQLAQNSIFDVSTANYNDYQITGIAIDQGDNIWVTEEAAQHHLYAKNAADGIWYKFTVPNVSNGGPIAIDDNGQVWFVSYGGGGIGVYNTNNTIADTTDDASYHLTTGVGFGNLPSNNAFSIAKDMNNNIWVGTDNGIGIISNCSAPFSQNPPCDAQIPIVQYDQYAGYLFAGSNVRSIAVDGANRKWVGTDDGVWLLSPDASKIIYRFTVDNSPLPSNLIQKIAIDKVTGDVYIGTSTGLVNYRSTATEGTTSNQNVLIFPNPVKSGYDGTISIKGLAANSDVRITDIDGHLVYRTTALGGQAVWNGVDYTGHRPQTGVYLVFVTSSDGSQTYTGKIVFMQ